MIDHQREDERVTDKTLTLTDFLLARIAEDEAVARAASVGGRWKYPGSDSVAGWTLYDEEWAIGSLTTYRHEDYDYSARMPAFRHPRYVDADANGAHIARHDPARVLAECEAKRLLVGAYESREPGTDSRSLLSIVLEVLAVPYADHPDYDEAWRP